MFKKVSYHGWENCYQLSNGTIELIVTGDVGPRIIHFGFVGGENEFVTVEDHLGKTGGDEWRVYGGHRLWHAPENLPRTYTPDNYPVKEADYVDGVLHVVQETEAPTGIQKQLWITMDAQQPKVTIKHRLTNHNAWAVEFAPWALSVMAKGGTSIIPLPPRGPHAGNLLPKNTLSLWAYTDFSDPRWTLGRQYFLLRQGNDSPQKVGAWVPDGWLAYVRNEHLFIKTFGAIEGAGYPDMGCNAEIYTDWNILELESLAPLSKIEPGDFAELEETWSLYDGIPTPQNDADVTEWVIPRLS